MPKRERERERYSWEEERGEKAAPDSCSPSSFAMYIVLLVGSPPSPLATLRFPSFLPSYSPYLSIYLSIPLSSLIPQLHQIHLRRAANAMPLSPLPPSARSARQSQLSGVHCSAFVLTDGRERERERAGATTANYAGGFCINQFAAPPFPLPLSLACLRSEWSPLPRVCFPRRQAATEDDDTGLVDYSDSLGTWGKYHCNRLS